MKILSTMEGTMKSNIKNNLEYHVSSVLELSNDILKQLEYGPITNNMSKDDYPQQVKEQTNLTKEVQDFIENIKTHI